MGTVSNSSFSVIQNIKSFMWTFVWLCLLNITELNQKGVMWFIQWNKTSFESGRITPCWIVPVLGTKIWLLGTYSWENTLSEGEIVGVTLCVWTWILMFTSEKEGRRYLKWVEEQLTIHADLPAWTMDCVRHPNKDNVVNAKYQDQHKGGLCQFPVETQKHVLNVVSIVFTLHVLYNVISYVKDKLFHTVIKQPVLYNSPSRIIMHREPKTWRPLYLCFATLTKMSDMPEVWCSYNFQPLKISKIY